MKRKVEGPFAQELEHLWVLLFQDRIEGVLVHVRLLVELEERFEEVRVVSRILTIKVGL